VDRSQLAIAYPVQQGLQIHNTGRVPILSSKLKKFGSQPRTARVYLSSSGLSTSTSRELGSTSSEVGSTIMHFKTGAIRENASEKTQNARRAFSSWQGFKDWVTVPDTALDQVSTSHSFETYICIAFADMLHSMDTAAIGRHGPMKILTLRLRPRGHGDGGTVKLCPLQPLVMHQTDTKQM
jgi:hypothetical protein